MKLLPILLAGAGMLLAFAPALGAPPASRDSRIFPFNYFSDDLSNGLRVVTVRTPYPDLVAFWAIVRAGSRNEVEPGKTGFAHFFEHMMFRGTKKYPPEKYNEILKIMGADQNAFTSDDLTAYHTLFGKEDLEKVMELESDRFQHLDYSEEGFRTEAKAVLGEYNKNSANPISKLLEVIRDRSFTTHTYKHTTMGFLKDIEDMPNQFEYSKTFFDRFYRPENVVLLVVGDVERERVLGLAKKYWGGWQRGGFTQQIPVEPEPDGPYTAHVDWPSPTLPWIFVGYRGPAFSDERPDMAALDLAAQIAFSQSSPLYQQLVIDEQKVDTLFTFFGDHRDPGLLIVGARVKAPGDVEYVKSQILGTVEGLRAGRVDPERLAAVKSNLKYGFAQSMDSTQSVAGSLSHFIQLTGNPESVNKVYGLYDKLTVGDVKRYTSLYFTPERRTIATLATEGTLPKTAGQAGAASAGHIKQVLAHSEVPLVSLRVLFNVGAANDPEGKEGVAGLTAAMISRGGTRTMSYEQIVQALFPLASGVSAQMDKEMTVFTGTTHVDNLDAYYGILSSMILDPGWDEDDFRRVKDDAINFLKINLRGNNDEELGKEVLYQFIYGPGHPYGHESTGTVASLEKLTLEDVKQFYREHYTRANLTLGIAGGYPAGFEAHAAADFSRLPEGSPSTVSVDPAAPITGQHLRIVKKDTRATAISLGFPIPVTRSDEDWPALWLVSSYFGQHRSSNSYLYQRMRELRGLNYGDYAYVEYFPRGMFLMRPEPNLGRQRQIFQIWIRPVEPENGHFALRTAMYELKKLVEKGMSEEDFQNTRSFLTKYVAVLATTPSLQLGYALDSRYYGTGDFVPWVRERLAALTLEDVNRAIRKYMTWQNVKMVVVTKDAEAFRKNVLDNAPSPISYNAPKPQEILNEDKVIETFPLSLKPENVETVNIEDVFSR